MSFFNEDAYQEDDGQLFMEYLEELGSLEDIHPDLRFISQFEAVMLFEDGSDIVLVDTERRIAPTRINQIRTWNGLFAVEK